MARIDAFLKLGLAQGCSDVHLAVGVPPMLRMHGDLMPIKFRELSDTELDTYVAEILTKSQQDKFESGHDLDFSYVSEDGGRFRVNLFRKDTGIGATFRHIPTDIPTMESLVELYSHRGDWLKAAQMMVRAQEVTPNLLDKVRLLFDAARIYLDRLGQLDQGRDVFFARLERSAGEGALPGRAFNIKSRGVELGHP